MWKGLLVLIESQPLGARGGERYVYEALGWELMINATKIPSCRNFSALIHNIQSQVVTEHATYHVARTISFN